MFKSLWTTICVVALANLFAILGFVGWLHTSGRLNRDRIDRMREMFAVTVATEQGIADQKSADANAAQQARDAAAKVGTPPLTAEQRLESGATRDEAASQHAQRVQRETADLIKTLLQEREELERDRDAFDKEVKEFNSMRERIARDEGSEQFGKAVSLYQSLKPEQAQSMMSSLIREGHVDQVVSYLDALASRSSSKIIAEFQKKDPALAADLLERLRTRGSAVAATTPPAAPEG